MAWVSGILAQTPAHPTTELRMANPSDPLLALTQLSADFGVVFAEPGDQPDRAHHLAKAIRLLAPAADVSLCAIDENGVLSAAVLDATGQERREWEQALLKLLRSGVRQGQGLPA